MPKTSADAQYKKMTETPVPALIVRLSIPTIISMLVTNVYNMADTWFVGRIGTSASGAVGVVFGLMAIIQAFGFMFGHGAGSIISRRLGARDLQSASRFASTGFFCALGAGGCIAVLGLCFLNPLMRVLGSTETILPYARTYGAFILLAAPFMAASCVLNNILRYEGRAALAMIGLSFGSILNIFGDFFLMEILHLGVLGAGLSTALSQCVSFGLLLFMFLSGRTQSKLSLRSLTRQPGEVLLICQTGLPSLMRQGLSSVSTMALNSQAALFGDAAVAAMSITNRISMLLFSVALGIGQGFQPVSAFNYGAKKYGRVRSALLFTMGSGIALLGVLSVACLGFTPQLIGFFRDDAAVIEIGRTALFYNLCVLGLLPVTVVANMLFQSVGHSRAATFLASLRSGVLFIPLIFSLSALFGLRGVQLAQPLSDLLALLISIPFLVRFLSELKNLELRQQALPPTT